MPQRLIFGITTPADGAVVGRNIAVAGMLRVLGVWPFGQRRYVP
jgi:hypothetical protein